MEERHSEQVATGEKLPVLNFPVTWKTLVMHVVGTRDFMPYHHNSAFSKATGSRDAFLNTMFYQGLFGRQATDWAGPRAVFRSMTLDMRSEVCPGDLIVSQGSVKRVWQSEEDSLVELEFEIQVEGSVVTTSTVVLALPTEDQPDPTMGQLSEVPEVVIDPSTPDALREALSKPIVRVSEYVVSEAQIMYWCEMVQDPNPLYIDGHYARESRYGGVIAPPTSIKIWCLPRATQNGPNVSAPDVDLPDQAPWPNELEVPAIGVAVPGTTEVIAAKSHAEFGAPIRPGDTITSTTQVIKCSALKQTRLGYGYFVTRVDQFHNQEQAEVGRVTTSTFHYGMSDEAVALAQNS